MEDQTGIRVDGRSAPSTLSLPKSASAGGLRLGFPWARYYDLAHGNPISHTHIERDFGGVVRRGEVPPFGARADGPHLMSDAANE